MCAAARVRGNQSLFQDVRPRATFMFALLKAAYDYEYAMRATISVSKMRTHKVLKHSVAPVEQTGDPSRSATFTSSCFHDGRITHVLRKVRLRRTALPRFAKATDFAAVTQSHICCRPQDYRPL